MKINLKKIKDYIDERHFVGYIQANNTEYTLAAQAITPGWYRVYRTGTSQVNDLPTSLTSTLNGVLKVEKYQGSEKAAYNQTLYAMTHNKIFYRDGTPSQEGISWTDWKEIATTEILEIINIALDNKVDKINGKGLSTNDFTTAYKSTLDNLNTTIATAVSNLEMIEVVTNLPTSNIKTNKLYLKANSVNGAENKYDFYVRVNNAWEKIDSLDFSISDYIKKDGNTNLLLSNGSTKEQSAFLTTTDASTMYQPKLEKDTYNSGDLNNEPFTVLGWYNINCSTANSISNIPAALNNVTFYGKLEVKEYNIHYKMQILYALKKGDSFPRIFYRKKGGSSETWDPTWKEIADTDTYLSKTDASSTYQPKIISGAASKNVVTNANGEITTEPKLQVATGTPLTDSTLGSIGSSDKYAKEDHRHPKTKKYSTNSSDKTGYLKLFRVTPGSWVDEPFVFRLFIRSAKEDVLCKLRFNNKSVSSSSPATLKHFYRSGGKYAIPNNIKTDINIYVYDNQDSTFDIILKQLEGSDAAYIDFYNQENRFPITDLNTRITAEEFNALTSTQLTEATYVGYSEDDKARLDSIETGLNEKLSLTGGTLTGAVSSNNNITTSGTIQGATIKKTNGTSSQFLKADGSVDSNTYLTTFTEIPASSDLDTYRTGGFYYCNGDPNSKTIKNCPKSKPLNDDENYWSDNKAFFLLVETWGITSTYVKQTLTYHNNNETHIRTCSNGTWMDWKKVPSKTSELTNDSGYLTQHQDISGKINTSAIKNDLTTGGATNVLSAEQGKTLKSLIDTSLPKLPDITDGGNLNSANDHGWCRVNYSSATYTISNLPSQITTTFFGILEIKKYTDNYISQTLYAMKKDDSTTSNVDESFIRIFYRKKAGGTWDTTWKEISTTDHTHNNWVKTSGNKTIIRHYVNEATKMAYVVTEVTISMTPNQEMTIFPADTNYSFLNTYKPIDTYYFTCQDYHVKGYIDTNGNIHGILKDTAGTAQQIEVHMSGQYPYQ